MITPGLAAMIDRNDAVIKNFVGTGGVFVIDNPNKLGIVITRIKVHAFADLKNDDPATDNFQTENAAVNDVFFHHSLSIKSGKNLDHFHITQKRIWLLDTAGTGNSYTLPDGYTEFDVFLKHSDNVICELVHAPPPARYVISPGVLNAAYTNQQAPFGYGNQSNGGTVNLESLSILGGAFGTRPMGKLAAIQPGDVQNDTIYYYPVLGSTILNVPRTDIEFALCTIPVVEIQYVITNKPVNENF